MKPTTIKLLIRLATVAAFALYVLLFTDYWSIVPQPATKAFSSSRRVLLSNGTIDVDEPQHEPVGGHSVRIVELSLSTIQTDCILSQGNCTIELIDAAEDKCAFVRNEPDCASDGFVDYLALHYCTFAAAPAASFTVQVQLIHT